MQIIKIRNVEMVDTDHSVYCGGQVCGCFCQEILKFWRNLWATAKFWASRNVTCSDLHKEVPQINDATVKQKTKLFTTATLRRGLCTRGFWSEFAKLRKAINSFFISVRLFACSKWAPTGQIFMKFNIEIIFRISVEKIEVLWKPDKYNG